MRGKTLGLIGCGVIARAVARKAKVFGLEILGCDSFVTAESAAAAGICLVSQEELLRRSDYISLHVSLIESTRNLLNREPWRR